MSTTPRPKPAPYPAPSGRTRALGVAGLIAAAAVLFLFVSLRAGGRVPGPTYVAPGNVGLVIDNYHGRVERDTMPAGTHWQGLWETVTEVPTAQRTLSLTAKDPGGAVQVNTVTNMLQVDVSAQYRIDGTHAADLYAAYQDQFAELDRFEAVNLEPAVKEAVNYAIGDMDTASALTTVGKQKAEQDALKQLNDEWAGRGIVFSNFMIRGIQQDQASKDLLSTTLSKMQEIENAKLGLQQQKFDNETLLSAARADAKVNSLQNAALTDLYVQDQMLSRVKTLYVPSDTLVGGPSK